MIICNNMLYGSTYAEAYSGKYFFQCDTYDEVKKCLMSQSIYISKGKKMSELTPADIEAKDKFYVLVEFSREENYTEHDLLFMTVQKKYMKRFTRFLRESGITVETETAA